MALLYVLRMSKVVDRLSLLNSFARIVDRGSISAAARDLGLSQASVSRHLAALENQLGAELIRRTTHNLTLTPAGEVCLGDARALLQSWDSLVERHAEDDGSLKGKLKIVAPVALGQGILADMALAFSAQHPHLQLDWSLSDDPINVAREGCDLWIRVGQIHDDSLIVRALGKLERLVVGVPALRREVAVTGPKSLQSEAFVAVSPFEGSRIQLTHMSGDVATLNPPVHFSTTNILTAHRAVLRGAGFAVMPRWLVAEALETGALVDVLPEWRAASLPLQLAYPPSSRQTRRLQAFIAHLKSEADRIPGLS